MHIDHQKLIELLTDASGIEGEKVEKQIGELIQEIQQALADGEAYEIEGFGIFSGLGNRVMFIPSKELETEINFKYVGMEPIELEEGQVQEEKEEESDPFEGLQGDPSEKKRDPFAGLVEGFDDERQEETESEDHKEREQDPLIFGVEAEKSFGEDAEEEYQPGPDEWGIEAHKEDNKGANRLISSLIGEEYQEEPEDEAEKVVESEAGEEVEDTVTFDDIFGESEEPDLEINQGEEQSAEEPVSGLDAELASLMGDDAEVKSEDELAAGMLDDDFSDIFGDSEEEPETTEEKAIAPEEIEAAEEDEAIDELVEELAGLEEEQEQEETPEEAVSEEEIIDSEEAEELQPEETVSDESKEEAPESEEQPVLAQENEFDDFDDPFLGLEEDEEETPSTKEEDIIPVITNISSDLEPVKKEEPKKKEKPKKEPKPKKQRESQQAPVFLWIILAMLIIVGTTIGLGYFSIINIPGITPQVAITATPQVATPPVQQAPPPVQQEQPTAEIPNQDEPSAQQPTLQEQEAPAEVPVLTSNPNVPNDQSKYGMMGVANNAANDGYTIVLYSLSVEANAFTKQQELSNDGYRALVTPIASAQYGTLWRVSIGQFATLTDAAIAAEDMPSEFRQSYFIKQIIN